MRENIEDADAVAFMSRHFVALTCHYDLRKADRTTERHVVAFSGFVLELHGAYFWVTAGHCLKQFDELLSFPEVHVCGGGFMDSFGYEAVHTQSVPFRYEPCCGYYVTQPADGIDFGLVPLNYLQVRAFLANKVIPISRENWVHQREVTFDFCFMLGIPKDRVLTVANPNGSISAQFSPSMISVNRISLDDLGEPPSDAEAVPTAAWFIGHIPPECTIRELEGMSGGPIYGFRRDEKGGLTYHVVALQSRWWNTRRIVFGCSLPLFADEVYQQLGALIDEFSEEAGRSHE